MAEISLHGVKKTYPNGFAAVHGLDLEVRDGELIVIVGPSGCGKSTLLRMVAGLETISEGELKIGGRRVNEIEPAARDIAMVFQNYALYPHMSVYDNMAYGLRNRRMPAPEIEKRVRAAAETLGLGTLLQRRPRQLSGGQRQRVAMGRAIVREPKAFLFDEPLSNLDAKLRVQVRVEIKRLQQRLATTSLYVTHDQVEAMTLADRLVVMNAGVAEQIGTPDEVYVRPASVFVAQFIGSPSMNLLAATLAPDGRAVAMPNGAVLPIYPAVGDLGERPVSVGLRPEHLFVAAAGTLNATIELVEKLGADTLLYARIDGDGEAITVRCDGGVRYKAGETLRLSVEPAHVHLFDAASGKRIWADRL